MSIKSGVLRPLVSGIRLLSLGRTLTPDLPDDVKPVCCLVHVFYPDLWPELARYLGNFGKIPREVRINVVDRVADRDFLARIRSDAPDAHIRVSPNRGRDIGGFFRLMEEVDFNRHDLICLIHTKRSPHMIAMGGQRWRRSLLRALLGSERQAAQNVKAMLDDPMIGIVGAREHRSTRLAANEELYNRLLDRLGLEGDLRRCEFVAGTMMMARSSVLECLFTTFSDMEFEDGDPLAARTHLDGQLAHAMERIIGNIARAQGLRFLWR